MCARRMIGLLTVLTMAAGGLLISDLAVVRSSAQTPARLRVLVVHGPNLNLLGRREPQIYGTTTLDQINAHLADLARELGVELVTMQSNSEGVIVDAFQKHIDQVDAALINAAGLSFSSVSIHDVIKTVPFPVIEVHVSNLATRDEIHRHSLLTSAVRGSIMGLGWRSYTAALRAVVEMAREDRAQKR
jgi:3-dehydroquinate dehydratase II